MKSKRRPASMAVCAVVVAAFLISSVAFAGKRTLPSSEERGGWLGVSIQDLSTALKEAIDYDRDVGVLVNDVEEESPAEKAGMKEGDIIIEYNGKPISSTGSLIRKVRASDAGDDVAVVVVRKGRELRLTVTVGETPRDSDVWYEREEETVPHHRMFIEEEHGWLGVHLQDLNDQLGEYFGVSHGEGALVTEVMENSPAETVGLKAGDVIVAYEGDDIDDVEELVEAVRESDVGEEVEITVVREKRSQTFRVTIGEAPEEEGTPGIGLFNVPKPKLDFDVWRFDEGLKPFKMKELDKKGLRDKMDRIRVYGDIDKDELKDLKKRLERLEREIEKLKDRL